jgi:hypothetical protein
MFHKKTEPIVVESNRRTELLIANDLLDVRQRLLNLGRRTLPEAMAQQIQDEIDRARFDVELELLQYRVLRF